MSNITLIKKYNPPPIDKSEIYRYAGMKADFYNLVDECIKESADVLSYNVCYCKFPIKIAEKSIDLFFAKTESADLAKNLQGCNQILVFAATVGVGIDRLILKYSKISPVKALIFQAIGAERTESLCNTFCGEIKGRPRFSPGYGDLPLELQKDIFSALDCQKIGLTLNESFLMSPSKSVTAIIGIDE